MGLNYLFIKGQDNRQALNSSFYVAFEDEIHCAQYAMAKGFKLLTLAQGVARVSEFDQQTLTLDLDTKVTSDELVVHTRMFEDFKLNKFEVLDMHSAGIDAHTLYSQKLKISFLSGWDDAQDGIFEDTYQSWIEMNQESFASNMLNVMIFSENPQTLIYTNSLSEVFPNVRMYARSQFVDKKKELIKLRPDLILFEIGSQKSYEGLGLLLEQLSYESELSKTLVSVFSHPSTSVALQKLYEYGHIISTSSALSENYLREMLTRLAAKKRPNRLSYRFHPSDPRAVAFAPFEIQITSITENEMTFMTAQELPLYTLIKMQTPFDLYLCLIPPLKPLSPNIHGYHYMGFICGTDHEDSVYLRRLVNYALSHSLKEWKKFDLGATEEIKLEGEFLSDDKNSKETALPDIKTQAVSEEHSVVREKSKKFLAKL